MIEIEIIAALGIFLGCFSRAILPFFRKKAAAVRVGQQVRWEGRYVWTLCFAIFVSMIATMLILPSFEIPTGYAFPTAFLYGWAAQDILNMVVK